MYKKTQVVQHVSPWLTRSLIAFLATSCTVAAAQTLVWSEEFNTGSAPDSDIWSYDLGDSGWGNQEYQNYTSDAANVKVESGNLVITALKSGSGKSSTFTSARLKSLDKLTFKYGTIEARIQTPDLANGLWPAFWTLGNDYPTVGWPECGEIDIMEMGIGGGVPNQRVGSHFHWDNNGSYANFGSSYDMPSPINGTFVVYRMEWTPTQIKTYINGIPIVTMTTSGIPEFNEPHFFLLNLAVGGTYTGITGNNRDQITASFPAEYKVDWIRIYDEGDTVLGGSSEEGPLTPGTNLLENIGFESGTTGWDESLSGGSAFASGGYAHEGTASLVIDSTGAGAWSSPNASQSFSASPGDVFNLRGYMLNSSATPIGGGSFGLFKIEFRDSGGTLLDPASIDVGTGAASPWFGAESTPFLNAASATDTWVFSETQAEAPAGTVQVRFVLLNVNDPANLGRMYFDDMEAILIGDPPVPSDPPVFTSNPVIKANATEDAAYVGQTLAGAATDTDGDPLSYSLLSGGPAWLNVATNGALSGTPVNADVGANSWTVQVSDGVHSPVSATLEIMVINVNDAPAFTVDPIALANTTANEVYSETIAGSATDVDLGDVLSYSLVPGGPTWLNMATDGALSGTPDNGDDGLNSWTVQVFDGMVSVTATLQITVIIEIPVINLLTNDGFESGTTDWSLRESGGSIVASTVYANSGVNSLMIDSSGAGNWASPNASQSFPASPGDVFNVQGYLLTPSSITDGSFGLFKIEFRDSGGTVLEPALVEIGTSAGGPFFGAESTPFLNAGSATDTWIFSEAQAEAPAGTVEVSFYLLNVNPPGNTGPSMYFDDIEAVLIGDPVLPVSMSSALVGGNVLISFPTQNGISYEMVYKNSLTNANWTPIETIVGDGNTNSVSYPTIAPARFYGVLIP